MGRRTDFEPPAIPRVAQGRNLLSNVMQDKPAVDSKNWNMDVFFLGGLFFFFWFGIEGCSCSNFMTSTVHDYQHAVEVHVSGI